MATHNITGKKGEDEAVRFLKDKGYEILERNWHSSHFELDIIAKYHEWIVIVEVKTRSGEIWALPEEAVDRKKMKRIINAANHYILMNKLNFPVRFDVISVITNNEEIKIEHFEDAFLAMDI
jgi:putative endonuclease